MKTYLIYPTYKISMTELPNQCDSCGKELTKTIVRHDGDDIPLLTCVSEGFYAVIGMDGTPAVATTETPDTTTQVTVRTEFGDDLVIAANLEKGFYTTSESEVETLVGTN